MRNRLAGVDAKLKRADVHLAVLGAAIDVFLSADNYRFVGDQVPDPETGYEQRIIHLEVDEFPPDAVWGPMIGDVVHNLRSALDHLAWETARPGSRHSSAHDIEFPIFFGHPDDNPKVRQRLDRKLNHIRPEFHAVIERVQPYEARNLHHPLWLLNRLWNVDKHRTLHVTHFMFSDGPDDPANPMGYLGWHSTPMQREEHRMEISRSWGAFNDRLEEQVEANNARTRDVALGKRDASPGEPPWTRDYPFTNLPLRPVLRRIRRYVVDEIIDPVRSLLP
jgi:hypothetical protein